MRKYIHQANDGDNCQDSRTDGSGVVSTPRCPGCCQHLNVTKYTPAFTAGLSKNLKIKVVFFLCCNCAQKHFSLSKSDLLPDQIRIVRNVFHNQTILDWAVTHDLAIAEHQGDYISAIRWGSSLPKFVFDAYNDGLIDSVYFPPGGGTYGPT
jgi:hypothetical protein